MDLLVKQALCDARERLERLDPYHWAAVEAWVASVRPLIVAALHPHVEGFDHVTKAPTWAVSPLFVSTDRSGRRRDNFAEAASVDEAQNRRIASDAQQKILAFIAGLQALPAGLALSAPVPGLGTQSTRGGLVIHNYGEAQVGDNYTTIKSSNVGAVAAGRGATATGSVTVAAQPPTQEQHRGAIAEAQGALVRDQDALDALDSRIFEALSQFLRLARDIQVEHQQLVDIQAKMKETLDEVWAEQVAKGMKAQLVPRTLEVAEKIATNPVLLEVARSVIGE